MGKRLFGSSGIRGLFNVDLTPILAARTGLAVATFSKARDVLVARDTRVSGMIVEDALVSGLLSGGADVKSMGVLPTAALAFLTRETNADAGIMITASHNPPEYNGIKIFDRDTSAYDEKSQDVIQRIIDLERFRRTDWPDIGKVQFSDQSNLYVEMIRDAVTLHRKWRIIVDSGCGATYSLAPTVFKKLGCKVTALNAQPDGFFPARSPEPNAESLKALSNIVKILGADLGLAYDGDGDRVAFIDREGRLVDFDRVLAAYAAYVVKKRGGGTVVTNVEASMGIEKMVKAHGGKLVRTEVGDVYLSQAIKKHGAIFGGEPCGAWIHPKSHYCPDGILSSALVLQALEDEDKNLAELVAEVPHYSILKENVICGNELKHRVVESVGEELKSTFARYKELPMVDGVRLSFENCWILVRASGTEPVVRLTVEGESLKAAREIMEKGIGSITKLLGRCKR